MKVSKVLHNLLSLLSVFLVGCSSQSNLDKTSPTEITSFPIQIKTDDINFEFSGYEIDDNNIILTLCFDPPSPGTWFFEGMTFKLENQEFTDSISLMYPHTKLDRKDNFDCQTTKYYNKNSITLNGKAELYIGHLDRSPDDDDWFNCERAQKHLDEKEIDIVVTCDPEIMGYSSGFMVIKKPISMSNEKAYNTAKNEFTYTDTIQLDWKFSFFVEKP